MTLKWLDAIHPRLVNVRADHWKSIYQLYHGGQLFSAGLFKHNYLIAEERQLLFIEEYDSSILDTTLINTDEDVISSLRIFDLSKGKTGSFSKLKGGTFKLQSLTNDTLVFSKVYSGLERESEIDISTAELRVLRY